MAPWALLSAGVLVRTGHTVLTWGITLVLFLHDTALRQWEEQGELLLPLTFLLLVLGSLLLYLAVSLMDPGYVNVQPQLQEEVKEEQTAMVPQAIPLRRCRYCLVLRGAGLEPASLPAHSSPCGPGTAASAGAACAAMTTTAPGWRTAWGSATTRSSWPTWRCSWWCFCGASTWPGLASISSSLGGCGCAPAGCCLPPSCCSPSSPWWPACSSPRTSTWWPATLPPGSSSPRTALPISASAPATPSTAA
ncbi:palmitoyltransferase ZDHHC12 isoform X2 [Meles meles]|uniref:palmitoyltransferase ZDHHC12 isoform X2 n=1 Tax=Meles meles TaxID=9662 RepID=UPI001E69BCA6|nr:palmitoyltransferase ZDHHC12 isoform X2 [Meles meles]